MPLMNLLVVRFQRLIRRPIGEHIGHFNARRLGTWIMIYEGRR
jgi:hypothetical protein